MKTSGLAEKLNENSKMQQKHRIILGDKNCQTGNFRFHAVVKNPINSCAYVKTSGLENFRFTKPEKNFRFPVPLIGDRKTGSAKPEVFGEAQ